MAGVNFYGAMPRAQLLLTQNTASRQPGSSLALLPPASDTVHFGGKTSPIQKLGLLSAALLSVLAPVAGARAQGNSTGTSAQTAQVVQTFPETTTGTANSTIHLNQMLEQRPFAPLDGALFTPSLCNTAPSPAAAPPAGVNVNDPQALWTHYEGWLNNYMAGESPETQAHARAIFNGEFYNGVDYSSLLWNVEDPALRAGLATMLGTVGEPAIRYFAESDKVIGVRFGNIGQEFGAQFANEIAVSHVDENGYHSVIINEQYRYEPPALFGRFLLHEGNHQDHKNQVLALGNPRYTTENSYYEEFSLMVLEPILYMQQLVKHPELAHGNTPLTRSNNSRALFRLNSGTGSTLGLYNSNRPNLVPAAGCVDTLNAFSDIFTPNPGTENPTPGNAMLDEMMFLLSGRRPPAGQHFEFSNDPEIGVLSIMEQAGNGPLTPLDLLKVAIALNLDIGECDIPELVAFQNTLRERLANA